MGAAVAVIHRKQRDIVEVFQGAQATAPERARVPDDLGIDRGAVFNGLVRRAVIREAGGGRYYVDELSWKAMHSMRHRKLAVVGVIALLAIAFFLFLSYSRS